MIRQLDVPIYGANILFLVEVDCEEFAKFLDNETNKNKLTDGDIEHLFEEIDNEDYGGGTYVVNKSNYIVLIKNANKPYYYLHELYHCVNTILQDRKIPHSENDEPYAYLIGWIGEEYSYLLKEFNEETKEG